MTKDVAKETPLISVILPVYNEPLKYFSVAYESVLNQTYKNIEIIIIVDNPNHQEAIEYFSKASAEHKNTRLEINEANIGLIKTLNKGLGLASGEFIARMDSDDISYPDRLEKQLAFLQRNSLDLVGGDAKTIDPDSKILGNWSMPRSPYCISWMTKYHTPVLHPTWLCRKTALLEVDGYRDIKHVEDHDLLARLQLTGFKLGNLPTPVIQYRINPDSVSNVNSQWAYWGRIFVGDAFEKQSLNEVTGPEFESFIANKVSKESGDPRAEFHLIKSSLKALKIGASLRHFLKLTKDLPTVMVRIKYKVLIKTVLLVDKIEKHPS